MCQHALCGLWSGSLTASASTAAARSRARCSGLGRFDLNVVGEGQRVLDEAAPFVQSATDRGELRDARGIESSHVHDRGAVGSVSLDVEHRNDRRIIGGLDRAIDRRACVGDDCERWRAQNDAVSDSIPSQGPFRELVASVVAELAAGLARVCSRRASEPTDEEHVLIQLLFRDLEIQFVVDSVHGEHAPARSCIASDHAVVRSRLRGTAGAARVTARSRSIAASSLSAARWSRKGAGLGSGRAGGNCQKHGDGDRSVQHFRRGCWDGGRGNGDQGSRPVWVMTVLRAGWPKC